MPLKIVAPDFVRVIETRHFCWYDGIMNVSVAAIAVEDGKYFIAKRKSGGSMGGKWEFPGGKCDEIDCHSSAADGLAQKQTEGCIEALLREMKEEFDVDVSVGKKLASGSFENKGVQHKLYAYAVSFLSKDFKLNDHTEYKWALPSEIEELDFTPSDLDLLRAIEFAGAQD
ncbi:MAG: (deoxy)nucleoside triphosphate pyrophosphohydrolase [Termitinemataceae bacterium]|nr:MAG: (deoxy)nucleoside triphosphate pyrophosphohydrolase [Termitinemataceae bacterium]